MRRRRWATWRRRFSYPSRQSRRTFESGVSSCRTRSERPVLQLRRAWPTWAAWPVRWPTRPWAGSRSRCTWRAWTAWSTIGWRPRWYPRTACPPGWTRWGGATARSTRTRPQCRSRRTQICRRSRRTCRSSPPWPWTSCQRSAASSETLSTPRLPPAATISVVVIDALLLLRTALPSGQWQCRLFVRYYTVFNRQINSNW